MAAAMTAKIKAPYSPQLIDPLSSWSAISPKILGGTKLAIEVKAKKLIPIIYLFFSCLKNHPNLLKIFIFHPTIYKKTEEYDPLSTTKY